MIKKLLEKIKRIWCSMKCCFESKCSMDNTEDGVHNEIIDNVDNVIYKLKNNLDETDLQKRRRSSI